MEKFRARAYLPDLSPQPLWTNMSAHQVTLALHVPRYEHRRPEIARALLGIVSFAAPSFSAFTCRTCTLQMDAIEQHAHAHIEHLNDPNSLAWHERLFKSPENRHREAEAIQRVMDGFPATRKDLEKVLAELSTRAEQSLARGGMGYRAALRYRGIGC